MKVKKSAKSKKSQVVLETPTRVVYQNGETKLKKPKKKVLTADSLEIHGLTRVEALDAATYSIDQVQALVGIYYAIQKARIGAGQRLWAHEQEVDIVSDPLVIQRIKEDLKRLEKQTERAIHNYAKAQPLGRWVLSIDGIGPVLAGGLLAHIDVSKASSASAVWNFAGLNPDIVWIKGKKRPYNARLKTLCWKVGESFKRLEIEKGAFYARLYRERKELEVERNERGDFAEQAHKRLEECVRMRRSISDEQKKIWGSGKLQPVGLDRRAMRYAVKIFLGHYYEVGRALLYGEKDIKPWIIVHGGHRDYIPPPNQELLKELLNGGYLNE